MRLEVFCEDRLGLTRELLDLLVLRSIDLRGKDYAIRVQETLVVDDTDAYIQAGIQGLGLIRVASYLVAPYLHSGALVTCMDNHSYDLPLALVYPQNRFLPPAVRAFYDWCKTALSQPAPLR